MAAEFVELRYAEVLNLSRLKKIEFKTKAQKNKKSAPIPRRNDIKEILSWQ